MGAYTKSERASRVHVVVVGAGPGGTTAAALLARRGFRVTVVEKEPCIGGRNAELRLGDYRFDVGPTFLMMKFLLDGIFTETGRRSEDYLSFVRLDPMYELDFGDVSLFPSSRPEAMAAEIERVFPGQSAGFARFMERERVRFLRMYPCLQKDYCSPTAFLAPIFLRALPRLSLGKSLYDVLSGYFEPERLRLSFTFQSKYLGMSPWSCPGAFAIISFIEYAYGVYHVQGGLCKIAEALAKVAEEEGADIRLNAPVKKLLLRGREVRGVELEDGSQLAADAVVINADFAHAMTHLVEPGVLKKYSPAKLAAREYSCSTFMLYLGLDKSYDLAHHRIVFARDYHRNLTDIAVNKTLSDDFSFYVRNATVTDPGLAPEGHAAIYVLVPVPNNTSRIDWAAETPRMRERVLDALAARTPMKDIRDHIRQEAIIAPNDWEEQRGVFLGATFNLAHRLSQMLYLRPHNRFEELDGCYLVGGGTHPGSGLPTIYESGRISANLLSRAFGVPFEPPPPLPV
ncbi:MAG TPA: phytoene desaturase [Planctomycetes bacterium]|nr:phytoene desaturase [Planctomycetota bacterium]